MTTNELINLFFSELKHYNNTNFKTLAEADLHTDGDNPMVMKAFSSALTRYLIFQEKHPEITDEQNRILYYKLKFDLIGKYFSEYPETNSDNLVAFQVELRRYVKEHGSDEQNTVAV
jgi:hypothetical protein